MFSSAVCVEMSTTFLHLHTASTSTTPTNTSSRQRRRCFAQHQTTFYRPAEKTSIAIAWVSWGSAAQTSSERYSMGILPGKTPIRPKIKVQYAQTSSQSSTKPIFLAATVPERWSCLSLTQCQQASSITSVPTPLKIVWILNSTGQAYYALLTSRQTGMTTYKPMCSTSTVG